MSYLELGIAMVTAVITAVIVRLYINRNDPARNRIGNHDVLMRRAEAYVDKSGYLKKACADYRKTGHLSARQVEQVEKALARVEPAR